MNNFKFVTNSSLIVRAIATILWLADLQWTKLWNWLLLYFWFCDAHGPSLNQQHAGPQHRYRLMTTAGSIQTQGKVKTYLTNLRCLWSVLFFRLTWNCLRQKKMKRRKDFILAKKVDKLRSFEPLFMTIWVHLESKFVDSSV